MKYYLIILMLFSVTQLSFAQKIEYQKVFGGYKFSQNDINLKIKDFLKVTEQQQEIHKLVKSANSNLVLSTVIGTAGGALVGWPLGTAIGGGDPEWVLAGIGAGLIAISIPITKGVNKKLINAADLYNQSIGQASAIKKEVQLDFKASSQGVRLVISW